MECRGCFALEHLSVTCLFAASVAVKIIIRLNCIAWVILDGDCRPGFSHVT